MVVGRLKCAAEEEVSPVTKVHKREEQEAVPGIEDGDAARFIVLEDQPCRSTGRVRLSSVRTQSEMVCRVGLRAARHDKLPRIIFNSTCPQNASNVREAQC